MPVLIALVSAAVVAWLWYNRARTAGHIAQDLVEAASDVMNAARRFGFRRRANVHPVDSIDDSRVAIAALGCAFLELDDLPTAEQRGALLRALQKHLAMDLTAAEEAVVLGRWLVNECSGPAPAVPRLARRLAKLDRAGSFQPLLSVLNEVSAASGGTLSTRQTEALEQVQRAFGIS